MLSDIAPKNDYSENLSEGDLSVAELLPKKPTVRSSKGVSRILIVVEASNGAENVSENFFIDNEDTFEDKSARFSYRNELDTELVLNTDKGCTKKEENVGDKNLKVTSCKLNRRQSSSIRDAHIENESIIE